MVQDLSDRRIKPSDRGIEIAGFAHPLHQIAGHAGQGACAAEAAASQQAVQFVERIAASSLKQACANACRLFGQLLQEQAAECAEYLLAAAAGEQPSVIVPDHGLSDCAIGLGELSCYRICQPAIHRIAQRRGCDGLDQCVGEARIAQRCPLRLVELGRKGQGQRCLRRTVLGDAKRSQQLVAVAIRQVQIKQQQREPMLQQQVACLLQ